MSVQHFILHAASGDSWQVHDPVSWCLENADQPTLVRAKAGLLTLNAEDAERIIRVVTRRSALHFIDLRLGNATVHYWVKTCDLRPYFKKNGLASQDVKVILRERKHEVIIVTTGAEFLYGLPVAFSFPVELYRQKRDGIDVEDRNDVLQAPGSWTHFSWDGAEVRGVPWAALKAIWRREQSPLCLNCDQPVLTIGFGWRRTIFNRYPLLVRVCLHCRRRFDDGSCWEMDEWVVKHLDDQTLPRFQKVWNFIASWTPPPAGQDEGI